MRTVLVSALLLKLHLAYGESPEYAVADNTEDDAWTPPSLPCTTLIRLHWEGGELQWNKQAIGALKAECMPDEVIDGFDWHVIFRYKNVDHCERAYKTISNVLSKCADKEHCYTHPYVKDIEYIGDTPEQRRKHQEAGKDAHVEL
mmetsp:Transcript_60677/g.112570  ORF Transcript_60677/g.112570 Transcript_60677/m.112570 type:complete len:145 (-) Transcript_60677:7-441(-)